MRYRGVGVEQAGLPRMPGKLQQVDVYQQRFPAACGVLQAAGVGAGSGLWGARGRVPEF